MAVALPPPVRFRYPLCAPTIRVRCLPGIALQSMARHSAWGEARPQEQRDERATTDDGTCLLVEPFAGDRVEDNLNPVGRVYYGASSQICVPVSLARNGPALGAQAGEARLREVMAEAGFSRFRRATQTPFNLVLEARP